MEKPTNDEILEAIKLAFDIKRQMNRVKANWLVIPFNVIKEELKEDYGYDLEKFATDNGYQDARQFFRNETGYKLNDHEDFEIPSIELTGSRLCESVKFQLKMEQQKRLREQLLRTVEPRSAVKEKGNNTRTF